jgi:hypothetical protein
MSYFCRSKVMHNVPPPYAAANFDSLYFSLKIKLLAKGKGEFNAKFAIV